MNTYKFWNLSITMKRAIITGASEGLGLEIAKVFIERGYEVIGISRTKPSVEMIHIKADLTKEGDIKNAISIIKKEFSEFNFLINCAGVLSVKPLNNLDYAEIEDLFRVNVFAQMKLVSGLLHSIKNNEADILNVGSSIGFKAYVEQLAYGSSKWAVMGINKNLQLELKNSKCRVIGFNPGGFKSRIHSKATGKKKNMDAYMEPRDLAKLMLYLLELPKNMEVSEIIINRKS